MFVEIQGIPGSIFIDRGFLMAKLYPGPLVTMEFKMCRSVLLVLMGLMVFSSAMAAVEEKSVVAMGEIVVTAGRIEETVQEQTMNVTVISSEEIEASPARDLSELLAENSVGYIQKYPGALTTASIRGFKTNAQQSDLLGYSLVLLNGRRAGTGNLAMIMMNDIERIEIIRGPGAVQYGSAAMGGVINIITREGAGSLNAEVFASYGSYDFVEGGFQFSGEVNQLDYSLGYSRSSMNDYRTAADRKYFNTGFDGKQSISLSGGYNFADLHRLGLSFKNTKIDHTGAPNYLSLNDLDDYRDSEYQAIDVDYFGETLDGTMSWKVRLFDTEIEDISYDPVMSNPDFWDDGGLSFESIVEQQGMQSLVSRKTGPVNMVAGIDWYDYDVKSTFTPNRTSFENISGFLMAKGTFVDNRVIVDAGLRYDQAEVEVVDPAGKTEDHDNLIASFGLAYLFGDNLKVRAHYGEAFKMPGAEQLAANYMSFETPYVGNPDLDPESSRTYEAGVEYADDIYSASLGYFFTRFKDKISSKYDVAGGFMTWENTGKSEISGVELEVKANYALFDREELSFRPYVSLTYFDRYRDLENREDLKYMNEMNASYGFTMDFPEDFSARLNFAYHGRKWIEDWENYVWPGAVNIIETGGFTVVDLGVTKEFSDSGFVLSANIGNLFDKDYAFVKGYPMPGRNCQVSLKYRF